KGIIKGETERVTGGRGQRTEDGTTNSDARFHPGIARGVLEGNERAHKGNEHRRAHGQAEFLRDQQMSTLVQEQKQDKPNRPFPTPMLRLTANIKNQEPPVFNRNCKINFIFPKKFKKTTPITPNGPSAFFNLLPVKSLGRKTRLPI